MACCFYGLVRCLCPIGLPCLASVRAALARAISSEGYRTGLLDAVAPITEEPNYDASLLALMRPPPHLIPGALRRLQERRKVRVVARPHQITHGVAHLGAEGYR